MNIRKQVGSATTEVIVATLTLVPMFTLFTLVGKLSDVESAAQESARYQAWEIALTGAANTNTQDLKAGAYQRIMQEEEFIESDLQSVDVDENPGRHLWGMHDGADRQAMISFDEAGYTNSTTNRNAGLRLYALQWDLPIPVLDSVGIDGIDRDGLYNAKVNYSINEIGALGFNSENSCGNGSRDSYFACMERNNALLVDDWSAESPGTVVSRVRDLNPALFLWKPFTEVLGAIEELPLLGIVTPAFDYYEPFEDLEHIDDSAGFVLPDVIPQDRLGSYESEGVTQALD